MSCCDTATYHTKDEGEDVLFHIFCFLFGVEGDGLTFPGLYSIKVIAAFFLSFLFQGRSGADGQRAAVHTLDDSRQEAVSAPVHADLKTTTGAEAADAAVFPYIGQGWQQVEDGQTFFRSLMTL